MYKFTEEQLMIRDMVREFTKNEVAPYDKAIPLHRLGLRFHVAQTAKHPDGTPYRRGVCFAYLPFAISSSLR